MGQARPNPTAGVKVALILELGNWTARRYYGGSKEKSRVIPWKTTEAPGMVDEHGVGNGCMPESFPGCRWVRIRDMHAASRNENKHITVLTPY